MTTFPAHIKVRRPTIDDVSAVLALMLARNQAAQRSGSGAATA